MYWVVGYWVSRRWNGKNSSKLCHRSRQITKSVPEITVPLPHVKQDTFYHRYSESSGTLCCIVTILLHPHVVYCSLLDDTTWL